MSEYLALPDGAGCFPQDFSGPVVLRIPAPGARLLPTGLSPSTALLSRQLRLQLAPGLCRSYNPARALTPTVWALPRSLATTWGITIVFSSSGYLDVSVPRVRLLQLCVHHKMTPISRGRVAPFGNPRIYAYVQLPAAYRSLSRPSSPAHAKASTMRPIWLTLLAPAPGPGPGCKAALATFLRWPALADPRRSLTRPAPVDRPLLLSR
jgi:hypothetical protein